MKSGIKVLIRTEVHDAATGRVVRARKARENLVFDSALTSLATGAINFGTIFASCKIGSSNAANSIPGNTTTFTQVGTTITASAAFFTAPMVGGLFKYGVGTGGAEQYIQSVGGGGLTAVVVGAGMAVGVATAGTVWLVIQTALTTPLTALTGGCLSQTYVTSPGACSTTFPGGVNSTTITLQRTYQFPVQGAPYTVNEIGYSDNATNNGTCNGRLVLGSPDTIAITEFFVVQIAITFTLSPNVPTALGNVGTGIDTTGQVMFNYWDCHIVQSTGAGDDYQNTYLAGRDAMDGAPLRLALYTAGAFTLSDHIQQANAPFPAGVLYGSAVGSAYDNTGLPVGVARTTISYNFNTAGETLHAILFGGGAGTNISPIFTSALTTPVALPNGTFQGNFIYQRQITRTLSN
jgi:hypothetical protein